MLVKKLIQIASLISTFVAVNGQSMSGKCSSYPTNATCSSYIDYKVFIPDGVTLPQLEAQFQSMADLSKLLYPKSPVCYDSLVRYQCSKVYSKCESDVVNSEIRVYSACASACDEVNFVCTNVLKMAGYSKILPNCSEEKSAFGTSLQPDGSCTSIPTKLTEEQIDAGYINVTAIGTNFVAYECPAPFLKDPLAESGTNATIDRDHCRFGCCIPCPAQNYFYKEHWAQRGFFAADIVRFVSAVLSFILVLSYLVLPDKRRHPSLLILNLSTAIFIFSIAVFFSIKDPKQLQCAANAIESATIDNNKLCAAQGAIIIFGAFSTVFWVTALILNLHVHTVWNSNFFTDKYIYINLVCWGGPAVIMFVAIGLHAIKFEFANLCLVEMDYIFPLFFFPLAAIVCPSFLIHMATFFYIARIAVREGVQSEMSQSLSTQSVGERTPGVTRKHVIVAVKIQWRALLLSVIAIGTVLFYWLFYMVQMKKMKNLKQADSAISVWLKCMLTPGNTQNMCADVISDQLPPFPLMIMAETLVSMIGIWLFIMFAKRSLWREWNDLIYDLRRRGKSEKMGEQFFAL